MFSSVLLCIFLFIGLYTVDKKNSNMLMIEKQNFFQYNQISRDNHKIVFCGDDYLLNIQEINLFIDDTRERVRYGLEDMEIFIEQQSKIVNKVIDGFYNNSAE